MKMTKVIATLIFFFFENLIVFDTTGTKDLFLRFIYTACKKLTYRK